MLLSLFVESLNLYHHPYTYVYIHSEEIAERAEDSQVQECMYAVHIFFAFMDIINAYRES